MSEAAYDWSWATCVQPERDLQLVAASAGPGCAQKGQAVHQGWCFTSTGPIGNSEKSQGFWSSASTCLHLPTAC